jgi:aspartate/glutamate racemase
LRDSLSKIIDIRQCVLDEYKNAENLILLGTKTTTGVGLGEKEIGTYEKLRCEKFSEENSFIVPNPEQQEAVMEAIYNVKAGKFEEAKQIILDVASQIRKKHGDFPTILGCTELPLIFSELELSAFKFIDPTESLVARCQKAIFIYEMPKTYTTQRKNSDQFSSSKLEDLTTKPQSIKL